MTLPPLTSLLPMPPMPPTPPKPSMPPKPVATGMPQPARLARYLLPALTCDYGTDERARESTVCLRAPPARGRHRLGRHARILTERGLLRKACSISVIQKCVKGIQFLKRLPAPAVQVSCFGELSTGMSRAPRSLCPAATGVCRRLRSSGFRACPALKHAAQRASQLCSTQP